MLERLCTTWHGWVSAAVYLPAYAAGSATLLHLSVATLDRLHSSVQIAGKSAAATRHCVIFATGDVHALVPAGLTVWTVLETRPVDTHRVNGTLSYKLRL